MRYFKSSGYFSRTIIETPETYGLNKLCNLSYGVTFSGPRVEVFGYFCRSRYFSISRYFSRTPNGQSAFMAVSHNLLINHHCTDRNRSQLTISELLPSFRGPMHFSTTGPFISLFRSLPFQPSHGVLEVILGRRQCGLQNL